MSRLVTTASTLLTVLALSAVGAPATWAASATQDAYDGGGDVSPETPAPADPTPTPKQNVVPQTTNTSSLPFTGFEAGLIGVAGLGLVGVGLTLRRAGNAQR